MPNFSAFTNKYLSRTKVLMSHCGVSDAFDPKSVNILQTLIRNYEAIWDTGATATVITAKVAKESGLKPTGFVTSNHAGGTSKVNTYLVNVYLPNTITIPGVTVVEAILSGKNRNVDRDGYHISWRFCLYKSGR